MGERGGKQELVGGGLKIQVLHLPTGRTQDASLCSSGAARASRVLLLSSRATVGHALQRSRVTRRVVRSQTFQGKKK